jgi:hypothetical protein
MPYHGRCCRLPSSRYATKTDSWGGGKCFRTISWGRRSMRCYTRYSSTLVKGLHSDSRLLVRFAVHLFIMRRFAVFVAEYYADHAIHTRLCGMHWWTTTRFTAHACAYAAARTRKRKPFNHGALHSAHCIPDSHPYQVPGMKIEFVGTIRICGLVPPSALDGSLRRWLAFFVLYSKSGRSDDGSHSPLLPPCCRLRQSSGIRASQTFVRVMMH